MKLLRKLALSFASLLVTLAVLEIVLRLFWGGFYLKESKAYAAWHPTRAWQNAPNTSVPYGEPEFSTVVRHNAWGFRGPEISIENSDGRRRVFALGDSFTYGVGVENDETFCAVLEQLDPDLQVINAGVNGYSSTQELLMLQEDGLQFDPDLVLVAFFWNDVRDNLLRKVPEYSLEDGELRYTPSAIAEPITRTAWHGRNRKYIRHSYAYRFLSDKLKLLTHSLKGSLGVEVEDTEGLPADLLEQAWALEFAVLEEIDRVSREAGARMLLLIVPDQTQVELSDATGLDPDQIDVQERLNAFAQAHDIAVLDLLPPLREAHQREQRRLYYRLDRHLNALGNRVVAELIKAKIDGDGLLAQADG